MRKEILEGCLGKFRLGILVLLFVFGLFSIVGTGGGGGGSSSDIGGSSGGGTTAATMEEDIENKLGAILAVVNAEEVTEGLDVLTSLLEDENLQGLVTITPPLPTPLDLENLPDDISLSIDFGTGFTTEDGNVFRGGITINISIIRSTTGLRLEVEALFNNVTVNDSTEPYLNGRMTGFIAITQDGQGNMSVAGNISFENVRVNQKTISGSISLSSTNITLNLTNPSGTITVTFSDFVMGEERISGVITLTLGAGETPGTYVVSFGNLKLGDFTLSSGTATISLADEDKWTIDMDAATSDGPFDIIVDLTILKDEATDEETGIMLHTESPGIMGPYRVSMDSLTIPGDWETVPASGTMTFTELSTGKTATLVFNKTLQNQPPYDYIESP